MLACVLETADRYALSEINRKMALGKYIHITESMTDALEMKMAPDVTETFYFPLVGNIDEGDENYFTVRADSMEEMLRRSMGA